MSYFCHDCNCEVPYANEEQHEFGRRHQENIGANNAPNFNFDAANNSNTYFCHDCNCDVAYANQDEHEDGRRHQENIGANNNAPNFNFGVADNSNTYFCGDCGCGVAYANQEQHEFGRRHLENTGAFNANYSDSENCSDDDGNSYESSSYFESCGDDDRVLRYEEGAHKSCTTPQQASLRT